MKRATMVRLAPNLDLIRMSVHIMRSVVHMTAWSIASKPFR